MVDYPTALLALLTIVTIIAIVIYANKLGNGDEDAYKSSFAGPMSHTFEQRSQFTSQPHRYRIPGYVRDNAHEIVPINDLEQSAGVTITSTNPTWLYQSTDQYARDVLSI